MSGVTRRPRLMESLAGLSRRVEQLEVALARTPGNPKQAVRLWNRYAGLRHPGPAPFTLQQTIHGAGLNRVCWGEPGGPVPGRFGGFTDDDSGGAEDDPQTNRSIMALTGPSPLFWLIGWQLSFWAQGGTVPAGATLECETWFYKSNPAASAIIWSSSHAQWLKVERDTPAGQRLGSVGLVIPWRFHTKAHSGGTTADASGTPGGVEIVIDDDQMSGQGNIQIEAGYLWAQRLSIANADGTGVEG